MIITTRRKIEKKENVDDAEDNPIIEEIKAEVVRGFVPTLLGAGVGFIPIEYGTEAYIDTIAEATPEAAPEETAEAIVKTKFILGGVKVVAAILGGIVVSKATRPGAGQNFGFGILTGVGLSGMSDLIEAGTKTIAKEGDGEVPQSVGTITYTPGLLSKAVEQRIGEETYEVIE